MVFPDTYNLAADWVLAKGFSGELCLNELLLHTTNSFARGEGVRMSGMQLPHELTVLELGRMGRNGHPISMYKPIKLFENEKNEDFRYYA